MSEVLPTTNSEFWQPPAIEAAPILVPTVADACPRCETEFILNAQFCHSCGCKRPSPALLNHSWTSYFEFHNIVQYASVVRDALGLPLPSLVCFMVGVLCLGAALFVGFVAPSETIADFQAVQYWRMEWLLGGVAAFIAGILLRISSPAYK